MNYGVILLILALIFLIIGQQTKLKNNFLIILTTLFLGFNYNMGVDWREYKIFYEELIPKTDINNLQNIRFEKGYAILNYLFNKLNINYEFFQAIILIFCIFIILKLLEKKSKNFYVAFVYIFNELFLLYSTEPILRQFIAITIIIIAFKYIEEKKIIKYLILIFLAFQFHKSAVVGIFFYFFNYVNLKSKKKILISIILAYIISFNIKNILNLFVTKVSFFKTYFYYLNSELYSGIVEKSFLWNLYMLGTICIYFGIIIYTKYERKYLIYLNLAVLGIIFGIFANNFLILVRFNGYFIFPIAIAISNVDRLKLKFKIKKICVFFILFIQILLKYYGIANNEFIRKRQYYYQNYLIEMLKGKEAKSYYLRDKFMKNRGKEGTLYD